MIWTFIRCIRKIIIEKVWFIPWEEYGLIEKNSWENNGKGVLFSGNLYFVGMSLESCLPSAHTWNVFWLAAELQNLALKRNEANAFLSSPFCFVLKIVKPLRKTECGEHTLFTPILNMILKFQRIGQTNKPKRIPKLDVVHQAIEKFSFICRCVCRKPSRSIFTYIV